MEYIRDGTSFRILLPSLHRIYLKVSGAEAPRIPRDPKVEPVPAYALEAKAFVEKHLLHRDVNISVRSPGGSFIILILSFNLLKLLYYHNNYYSYLNYIIIILLILIHFFYLFFLFYFIIILEYY